VLGLGERLERREDRVDVACHGGGGYRARPVSGRVRL
jgi:hypothetical protein